MSNVAETLAAAFGQVYDARPSYKNMTSYSQNKFSILTKIVKWLQERHLNGDNEPLSLDEILDETEQIEIGTKLKNWLENEALEENPKVRAIKPENGGDGQVRYQYKPKIDIKDRKTLRKYLMDRYQAGEGAVWLEDILESLPHGEKAIKWLADNGHIVVLTRQADKRKIVFYNEGKQEDKFDEEFIKLWRSVSVDGVPEDKIEDYLDKHGIQSIQKMMTEETRPVPKRKVMRKQNKNFKAHNEHIKDILQDYSSTT